MAGAAAGPAVPPDDEEEVDDEDTLTEEQIAQILEECGPAMQRSSAIADMRPDASLLDMYLRYILKGIHCSISVT